MERGEVCNTDDQMQSSFVWVRTCPLMAECPLPCFFLLISEVKSSPGEHGKSYLKVIDKEVDTSLEGHLPSSRALKAHYKYLNAHYKYKGCVSFIWVWND